MPTDPIPTAKIAPPLPARRLPRAVWIAGVAAGLCVLLLVCAGVATGVWWIAGNGESATSELIVGKWAYEILPKQPVYEFRKDGSGTMFNQELLWKIEGGKKGPILVLVIGKQWPENEAGLPPGMIQRYYIRRNADALGLSSLADDRHKLVTLKKVNK